MKDEKKQELSELFLRNFIITIIEKISVQINKKIPPKVPEFISQKIPIIQKKESLEKIRGYLPSYTKEISEEKFRPLIKPIKKEMGSAIARKKIMEPIKLGPLHPQIKEQQEKIAFSKLIPFLNEPTISIVECLGPDKNLLIHRLGVIKTMPVMLKKEEIDEIMQYFSDKTRIPVIRGVFKAALQNLIITAVVSEFVGTRFYIEKIPMASMPIPNRMR